MTRLTITEGETRRRLWRVEGPGRTPIDFGGATATMRIEGAGACVTLPAEITGPGQLAVTVTATAALPPRSYGYPWALWVTWSDGTQNIIDRGDLRIGRGGCA